MKNSNKNFINLLSYVALVIVALLMVVDILGHFNILTISGGLVFNLLTTIKNLCVLIVIGCAAYNFLPGNKEWIKILFWVSVIVLIVGTVLMWL